MNNNWIRSIFRGTKYFVAAFVFFSIALFNSCKEDTGSIGSNVLPKGDLIGAYHSDTSTVLTSVFLKDSVLSSGLTNNSLGSYNDPVFGQVKGSIYTQVLSSTVTTPPWVISAGVNAVTLDSAVLLLPFNDAYYGNLDPQTFAVYTLQNNLIAGHAYYSDTNIKYNPTPIGVAQVTPNLASDTIRIKLTSTWMNYIKNAVEQNSSGGQFYYWTNFDSLVKGLYITASTPLQLPGQGSILSINLYNSFAGIYFYYHYNSSPDSAYYVTCPVGGTSVAYFNHFDHNYATAPFYSPGKDSINANALVYEQATGGVQGKIHFPYLRNWAKLNPVVINEAQVVLSVAQDGPAPFVPPSSLYLVGVNADGQEYALPDEAQSYYGGTYNAFNNTYTFVITQYIQSVINGKDTDRGLFIVPGNSAISANRVVLYGAQHNTMQTNQRLKLVLYYTPLKQ